MPTFYEILGISPDVNQAKIKAAYISLAIKWHPDNNPDNVEDSKLKFNEISEAYEVLSDPKNKLVYDLYQKEGLESGGMDTPVFSFHSAEDIFKDFFGTSNLSEAIIGMFGVESSSSQERSVHRLGGFASLRFDDIESGFKRLSTFNSLCAAGFNPLI